ncbi:MAG: glutamine amidotransferase [Pirellulales bacterium]
MSDSLVVGSPQWLIPAIVLVSVTALVLIWSLIRSPVRGPIVWFSGLVKLIAVASLACYLLEPMIRSERPRPGANLVAVAVDNSRSMEIRMPGQTRSLLEKLKPRIAADAPWQTRLAQDFSVRRYLFDERLRSVEDFSDCNFEGQGSSIGSALSTIAARFASRPTAGLIVFTDGMATDTLPAISELDWDMPIFPVIDFDKTNLRDLSVMDPTVSQSAFEVAPVRVEAVLQADGLDGEQIIARLFNEKGESVESATFKVEGNSWRKRIRFQYRPKELGIQFVTIRAMIAGEDKAESGLPESRIESTTANNARLVAVDRSGGPYRVLYIAGRPNWEFKFLRRALEEDDELDWDALVRIAKKEAKFSFRDRAVDSTNPLFAGFDNAAEDATEQYDEPIVIPLGLRDGEEELKAGFPKTAEGLYVYDAIIIDDLEAKFFSHDQMLLLRQFVSDRGGGLLMLGGQESFDRGGYRDTPIGDMLPVYLQNSETAKPDAPVNYRLTREGALEPWMRLRGSETEEARRLAECPRSRFGIR